MIPDYADNVEHHVHALFSKIESSQEYWCDPKSQEFHSFLYDNNYRYNIDVFIDETRVMLGILDAVDSEMDNLLADCGGKISVPSGNKAGSFHKGTDKINKMIERDNTPVIFNNGDDDYIFKGKKIIGKKSNPQHYRGDRAKWLEQDFINRMKGKDR